MNYRKLIISAASVVTAVSVALIIFAFSVNRSGDSAKSESLPQTTAAQTTRNKPNSAAAAPAATAPATSLSPTAAKESTAPTTKALADNQKSCSASLYPLIFGWFLFATVYTKKPRSSDHRAGHFTLRCSRQTDFTKPER